MTWNVPLAKRPFKTRPEGYTYPWVMPVVYGTIAAILGLAMAFAGYVAWIATH